MKKIKILFVIPSLNIAGAEKVCLNICDNLNFDEFEVHLISVSKITPLWDTVKNKDKIKFYTLNETSNIGFPWFSVIAFYKLSKLARKIKPNIVHSHLWGVKCIYLFSFLGIKLKPVYIATIHNSEFIYTSKKLSSRLFKSIENFNYKFFNFHLVSISHTVDKMIRKRLYYKTLTFIENGIDTDLFIPSIKSNESTELDKYKNNFPVLIHIGRASEIKRQIDIINAVSILRKDYPNIKLLLLGRDNKMLFGDLVRSLDLVNNIDFIPPNNEVYNYLQKADIGVFPSLFEGLSLAFAEMMSCALPLVITDIPSLTEMTNYNEAAEIVPVKSPRAIADKIKYLIDNPEVSKLKGKKAREFAVSKYSIHVMVRKYSDLYKSLFKV